jgi:hypothetical protein
MGTDTEMASPAEPAGWFDYSFDSYLDSLDLLRDGKPGRRTCEKAVGVCLMRWAEYCRSVMQGEGPAGAIRGELSAERLEAARSTGPLERFVGWLSSGITGDRGPYTDGANGVVTRLSYPADWCPSRSTGEHCKAQRL